MGTVSAPIDPGRPDADAVVTTVRHPSGKPV